MTTSLMQKQSEEQEVSLDEAIQLARGHHEAGNFVLAERTYNDILRAVPDHAVVNHLLGALYYQTGDVEKAAHFMKISIDIEPSEPQYWSNYGSVLAMSDKREEALAALEKAIELEPKHLEATNNRALTLWHLERYEESVKEARRSLELVENNLDGLMTLALALSKQEEFKEAGEIWKKASENFPNNPMIWSNWSNMHCNAGQPKAALALSRKAVEADAKNPEAQYNLGCALSGLGQSEEAVEAFTAATNITPKYYQAHHNKARALFDQMKFDEAAIAARYAIDFKDDYAPAYSILSASLRELGDFKQAHFAAQKAVRLDPEVAEYYLDLADVLLLLSHLDDGQAAIKEAIDLAPDDARVYEKLASIFEKMNETDDTIEAIDRAIELAPESPQYIARKASFLQIANRVDEALVLYDQVIDENPKFTSALLGKAEALISVNRMEESEKIVRYVQELAPHMPSLYQTLSSLKKFESEDDEDLKIMHEIDKDVEKRGLSQASALHFAFSNAYEHMKDYDKAFHYLEKANDERRQTIPYDSKSLPPTYAYIKAVHTPEIIKSFEGKGCDSDVPVFIVGMPRSGTTLTEQIISSHPQVFGAGELPDIGRARKKFGEVTPENAAEIGAAYVEYTRAREVDGTKALHITDKMPGNYMNVGLIASILPNAKIIHCGRSAMDTCLSNYKQNFMAGQYWSYDQEEMAAEYLRYIDLMDYWNEILPGRVLNINYEDTVSDLEAQARKLIEFVGLEWDDACAMPHKQKRAVLTASKAQVTQPVYTSSVQKWKRYEKHLQPLARILVPDEALPVED